MECDTTLLDHKWFWGRNTDRMLKGLDQLMEIYYQSVGRGCVLLLNSTPDTSGVIPESHLKRYEEFGREIARRFGRPLAETHGEGDTVELDLGRPTAINHAVTMEAIGEGQRVRAYRLEGLADGTWKTLVPAGMSIGHKQIDSFPRAEVSRVRLVVTRSAAKPLIRRLAVFHVEGVSMGQPLVDVYWPFSAAELADPEMLPEPGWIAAGKWSPGAFASHATAHDIDLTAGVLKPGQYEIQFCSAPDGGTLEIQKAELVISGRAVPDRVRRLPPGNRFSLYRMEQTTPDSPTAIRVTARVAGDKPCSGQVLLRAQ
jgi:alpha-L-fucosidase